MQRFFDIVFSSISLVLLCPVLLILTVILRITGEGEILFSQRRLGRDGNHFYIYKFVTMVKNSSITGTGTVTIKDDPRVLPLGKLLRKTKINELPQLINIFKGDMSFIGPRPLTQRCFDVFPKKYSSRILEVRPGLSGIGSIVFRNEENMLLDINGSAKFYDEKIMPYKGILEYWYISNQNIYSYFSLIVLTLCVVMGFNISIVWKLLPNIPLPPKELEEWI